MADLKTIFRPLLPYPTSTRFGAKNYDPLITSRLNRQQSELYSVLKLKTEIIYDNFTVLVLVLSLKEVLPHDVNGN